jgi:tRNA (guanine-N7-)-methyltransferase
MRLKHVKGASEVVLHSTYVISEPEKYKGKYKTIFNNDNPIHVEIGMGKGDFIIQMALQNPDINFIGIEKYDSVLVRAISKVENEFIKNLRFIRMDATNIENILLNEVDTIYLNFSDPWPKPRHEKRRLTSLEFLTRYQKIFKGENHILMKTDNRKLFEYSIISFVNYGFKIKDISLNLYDDNIKENVPTEYEIRFANLGVPIYKIDVYK